MTTLADRGGVCPCGAVDALVLVFGGRNPAHFECSKCKCKFDLDGKETLT